MNIPFAAFGSIQRWRIPCLEDELGDLIEKMRVVVRVMKDTRKWKAADVQEALPAPIGAMRPERQKTKSSAKNLAALLASCDWGAQEGGKISWRGYKLHIETIDGDFPFNAFLSSDSLHDRQVAILLIQSTSERITYLYDLMDSAYDARQSTRCRT